MYHRLTQKVLLKLAFIALMTPFLAMAGSGSKINQATGETSDPAHEVAPATPADRTSLKMIPAEIIKLILEGLAKPDLQKMRLVEKKLGELLPQFITDIKSSGNLPNTQQLKEFFRGLTTVKFGEGKKLLEVFVNLFRHAPIKKLDLTGQQISPEGFKDLGPIFPRSLEELKLSNNKIGDEEAKALAQHLPSTLIGLFLNKNNIGDEGAKALAAGLPATLQYLDLSYNKLGDEGAKAFAQHLPATLQHLFLNKNNIGDEGAKALAAGLPRTLIWLDLSANNIGDEGAKALAQRLPSTLIRLRLEANNIGDAGLTALLGAIRSTDLQNLDISVPEALRLREKFNNLHNRKGESVWVSFR